MKVALDIETKCAVANCSDSQCKHALHPATGEITCIGLWRPGLGVVLRGTAMLERLPSMLRNCELIGHNLKFDLKFLHLKGCPIDDSHWVDDTQLMGALSTEKVSPEYLTWYSEERARLNKLIRKSGKSHRAGKPNSLKVMAPYFLGVPPFWEDPTNHDNDQYVLRDCEYTYRLANHMEKLMRAQGTWEFYREWKMPRAKMLLRSELRGINIDLDLVKAKLVEAESEVVKVKEKLDKEWAPVYQAYQYIQEREVSARYGSMALAAVEKAKNPSKKILERYNQLEIAARAKIEPLNLNSPTQLAWIFRDCFGLDIRDFEGDESTGKAVLQRLAAEGRKDIETFLEYRKWHKLATAFFPSYLELNINGVLHCNFNPDGARTGRSSSSMPNLQQVPGALHTLFRARPGMKLADYDMDAIEAKIIAYYSEDPHLIHLVNSGDDFHGFNVVNAYFPELGCHANEVKAKYPKERAFSKTLGYAFFYGAGAKRIMHVSQVHGFNWPESKCKEVLAALREMYAEVFAFKRQIDQLAKTHPITNFFGNQISYVNDHESIYMQAFNSLVQGTASNMVENSMYRIETAMRDKKIDGRPLLFVHDEIVTEFDETKETQVIEIIKHAMTNYKLPTKFGDIKMECSGKTSYVWEK